MGYVVIFISVLLSGCTYVDWGGVWFGCPEGQVKKPATYSMFGKVKEPSKCVDEKKQGG